VAGAGAMLVAGASARAKEAARPERPGRLRAGAAAVKITPAKGVRLDGTIMQIGPAKEIHDDLYARAIVLDDGKQRVAIVVCDATFIERKIFDEAKALIHKQTRLPPDRVLASATHTHMAVRGLASLAKTDADRAYHRLLAQRIAEAVGRAIRNLAPAQIGWGTAAVPQFTHNRRWIMKAGTVGPNPFGEMTDKVVMHGRPAKNRLKPAGPVDPELSVLSVRGADGGPMAMLANYSIHYAGYVRGVVSADYFGCFAERVGELLGAGGIQPPFVAMMSNGTSGDIGGPGIGGGAFEKIRKVGHALADAALGVCKRMRYRDRVALAMRETEIELGVRRPDAKRVEWARAVLAGTWRKPAHRWRDIYARNTLELAKYPPTVRLKLQAVRIGDPSAGSEQALGIAAVPCEVYAETGLAIKKASPLKPTFTIELANGFRGYLPPPEQFPLGGYTTWPAESSCLEVQAEPKIRAAVLSLLKEVAAERAGA